MVLHPVEEPGLDLRPSGIFRRYIWIFMLWQAFCQCIAAPRPPAFCRVHRLAAMVCWCQDPCCYLLVTRHVTRLCHFPKPLKTSKNQSYWWTSFVPLVLVPFIYLNISHPYRKNKAKQSIRIKQQQFLASINKHLQEIATRKPTKSCFGACACCNLRPRIGKGTRVDKLIQFGED